MSDTQPNRLASGGLIDRSKPLLFKFDGKTYQGHGGDTLASALLASGVSLVGRSFKYHRPRGILSAGPEEPNALVELRSGARREPNTRATVAELYDGLEARSQNRWPSLAFDVMGVNSLLSPLLSAGFYYKTFMWPASFWEKLYEPLIRRAAGLGRGAGVDDPDTYEKAYAHCDILVIGAGATGLMAALAASRSGARVILTDEDFVMGGRALAERREIDATASADWAQQTVAELAAMPEVRLMPRTTVFGVYDGGTYGALERVNDHLITPPAYQPRQRSWRIIAKRTILAAGSIERPLVFGDNDRPGVMMAGAIRTYINRYAVSPGSRVVVFANNDEAVRTIGDITRAGGIVEAVVDPRPGSNGQVRQAADNVGARVVEGVITRAHGNRGVQGVDVESASGSQRLDCDLVAMSGGWSPTVHLTSHLGARPVWNDKLAAFTPGDVPPGMAVAGAANGTFALTECLASGAAAGLDAASSCGFRRAQIEVPDADPESTASSPLWRVKTAKGKAFIDLQNDVTTDDVALARQEGFTRVEHLKRYTTLGMATDQGKTANVNGLAMMAELSAKSISETGTTVFRPPYTPVAIGALAGAHRGPEFRATRYSPAHAWAVAQGASLIEAGVWLRASYFPRPGEKDWFDATCREVKAVRNSVGICDVSTLGKIDIQGKDAARFLDLVYTNTFSTLPVARARYGLMLREDGFVMDDGTTSRLGPDHFLMTTTTVNAGKVMMHLEFCHQVLFPSLDVQMISVSDNWAQFSVAGPKSREALAKVIDRQHDISNAAFPYMAAARMTAMGGIPARLFRISFSGELAYEIAAPARHGTALANALMEAGSSFGITPYGLEALNVMRIEKGHVTGAELNGQTTARDLGLGKMQSTKKDYIGRIMKERAGLIDPARPTLVGVKPVDKTARLRGGAHFLPRDAAISAEDDQGYLTSAAFSPSLDCWIGLGMLANGPNRHGEIIRAADPLRGGDTLVEVCSPVFYDPDGERLRG
jgi:methylglutamate dehydrogenase subunit C